VCIGLSLALGLCLATLPPASGQGAPEAQRVSLDIGVVKVWLGMPQKLANEEFAKRGYPLEPLGDDLSIVFGGAGENAQHLGDVAFRSGRLIYAAREWPGGDQSIESAFAVLTNFAREGSDLCSLSTEPLRKPDFQMERLWVTCGKRTLFVREKIAPRKSWGVTEWIGELPKKGDQQ
jgi:hypothetical protein